MASQRKRSLAQRKSLWTLVVGNSLEILGELPHLQKEIDELRAVEKEVLALSAKQARYRARSQELTKKLRALGKKGDNLRSRIGASIRGRFGFSHSKLIQFGFKPHRGGVKLARELATLSTPGETTPQDARAEEEGDAP